MNNFNISAEDKALFLKEMQGVKKLPENAVAKKHIVEKTIRVRRHNDHAAHNQHYSSLTPLSSHYTHEVGQDSVLAYCAPGTSAKQLTKLKNNLIRWQASLDLHGLNLDQSKELLEPFILKQIQQHKRCILIIHGKGGRFGEAPILKNHVNHWLQQLPQVLAFHSAKPCDGGNGALYVLLKAI